MAFTPERLVIEDLVDNLWPLELLVLLEELGFIEVKVCERCGDRFIGGRSNSKYCCEQCNNAAANARRQERMKEG